MGAPVSDYYQPLAGDVSGRDFQTELRYMLLSMLPAYELKYGGCRAPYLIKELNDILEFSASSVVGVADRAGAIVEYLQHHYRRTPKPLWYANLTGGE